MVGRLTLILTAGLLAAGCASKEPVKTVKAEPDPVIVTYAMDFALVDLTGIRLGMNPDEVEAAVDGRCLPLRRAGGREEGGVTELFCTYDESKEKKEVRIGFSNPKQGHRAWRIYLDLKGPNKRNAPMIHKLEEKYGPPRGDQKPLEVWWREDFKTLRVFGKSDGLRVELWDRSLSR